MTRTSPIASIVTRIAEFERPARVVVVVAVIAIGLQGTFDLRGLHADGAYYMWSNLTTGQILFVDNARWFAHVLTQWPIALAISLGVTNPVTLALLQSAGLVLGPVIIWAVALVLARRSRLFWLVAGLFSVVYLDTGFVAVGEYNLTYALVTLSAVLIVRGGRTLLSAIAVLIVAVLLLRSYEATLYLSPALAALVLVGLWIERGDPSTRATRVISYLTVLVYAAGAVLGGLTVLFPRDPTNRAGASDLLTPLSNNLQLSLAIIMFVVCFGTASVVPARFRPIGVALVLGLAVIAVGWQSSWARPWMHYESRTIGGLVLFAALVSICVWRVVRHRRSLSASVGTPRFQPLWIVATALLVSQVVPFALNTDTFGRWLAVFEAEVNENSGPIAVDDTALFDSATSRYIWPWTNPFLSRIFQDSVDGGMILNPGSTVSDLGDLPGPIPAQYVRVDDSITRP